MTYRALVAICVFLLTIASAQETASNSNSQIDDATTQPNNSTLQTNNSTDAEAEEEDKYADYSFDCLEDADGKSILGNT